MPEAILCPRCKKSGFIRVEHVIRGGDALHSYYCGACMYEWQLTERDSSKKPTMKKPAPPRHE